MSHLRSISLLCTCLAVVFVTALTNIGHAQPSDADKKEGVAHYKEGRALLAAKKYEEALTELEASIKLLPSPNTELLRGHALRGLGRLAAAMESYQTVKREAGERVRAGEKRYRPSLEEAGRYSAVLETKLGQVLVTLSDPPADVSVTIDGEPVTLADGRVQRWHAPGQASVSASTPDGREQSQRVDVAVGEVARVQLSLPEVQPAPSSEAAQPGPVVEEEAGEFPTPPLLSLIPAAVGVVGFAMFAAFGTMSASTASDLDACAPACPESEREAADEGERNQLIANIGLGVGIAGIAGFGVWWLVDAMTADDSDAEAEALRVDVGPGGAMLMGRF